MTLILNPAFIQALAHINECFKVISNGEDAVLGAYLDYLTSLITEGGTLRCTRYRKYLQDALNQRASFSQPGYELMADLCRDLGPCLETEDPGPVIAVYLRYRDAR